MKNSFPEHSAVWAHLLLDDLKENGISEAALFQGLGIRRRDIDEREARVPFDKIARLFERAAKLTGDDLIGWRLGQLPGIIRRAGLLAYVGVSSPTVGGYLRNFTRYRRILGDGSSLKLVETGEVSTLIWSYVVPAEIPTRQYSEFGAVGTLQTLRETSRRQIRPRAVHFAHNRADGIGAFRQFFGCNVQFGCSENKLILNTVDLDVPLESADDLLLQTLVTICETILSQKPKVAFGLIHDIERQVAARLSSGTAQLATIAAELGMSPRTFARRLADEGTSFTDIVSGLRKALARDYLRNSALPLTEIAFLLGYNDPSTFSTAFKRWYGRTPRDYRQDALMIEPPSSPA